jgi:transcriptional regulator of aromatic amino acid metabolism
MENSDKALVKDIMQLQKSKDTLKKQLAHTNLTPEKIHSLKNRLTQKSQEHTAKWDEIINSPNKKELINKIEQAQKRQLENETRKQEKTPDLEPEHI